MKKNNKNKKLPRYDIGTMKRLPLGYLQPKGIGQTTFSVEQGLSIDPETRALRANRIPNALNLAQLSFLYPLMSLQNQLKFTPVTNSLINGSLTAASSAAPAGTLVLTNKLGEEIASISPEISGGSAASAGVNTLGVVTGGIGTVLGGLTMANQIGDAGSHRSASDMQKTVSKNIYTTAGGNQYELYGTVNASPELAYENEMRKLKQLGFGINAIGTGASLGGVLGSVIPGFGNLAGLGIGAGVGLLAGGLASLFGFGDNEEEVRDEIRRENDALSRLNMMALAVGKTKDFEGRAANGKMPGFHNGKANARVSNGEVIGNFEDGYFRVPGSKNNKDDVKTHLGKKDFVISNKHGLSDYAWLTGDIPGALAALSYLQKTGLMNKYKNGKLPKYRLGTIADYALATLPHIGGMMSNIAQYNRAKYADTPIQSSYVEDTLGKEALNDLNGLRYDIDPYINQARKALAAQNWATRRNVNLGYGGRALAQNANFLSYLNALYGAYDAKNKAENEFITTKANAKARLGAASTDRMINSINGIISRSQLQNAQKLLYEDSKLRDIYTMAAAAANAAGVVDKYNDAYDINNKLIGIWQLGADTDRMKALADIQRLGASGQYNATTQKPYIPTSMLLGIGKKYQFTLPSYLNILNDEYWDGRRYMS